ncbi:MAG: peptidylprolyl isomerase [Thermococcus sp.]|uniref:FKBP-type peptidyl-prolyl cis-trans isomerase n=1 Tax=Thermococcus sp. TaxID=35749 RepID=UPI000F23DEED|nr:peptidylprolyl isomerase [Thermococcus sp.]MCD6140701.1 peptidylprolyl isomerase [Thermococcus sp.]RLF78982.1 MAG: peptidylprolyl isomerase [Thermococci archaeon]RLF84657.1 MAG: peptidylprolyl isomerase [Thermococci archaeon]HDG64120.1 peptidylprolyl isomerase [Thermococcus sp.]
MKVEKGDFVVFNYIGKFENGEIFDTTYENIAKEAGIYMEDRTYGPLGANVGVGELIPGMDEALLGMEVGERKNITIPPEKGYGMPRDDLIINVPTSEFKKAGIEPIEGAYIMTDSGIAQITTIGEENVTLDFNHPLAGKTLVFEVEIVDVKKETSDKPEA